MYYSSNQKLHKAQALITRTFIFNNPRALHLCLINKSLIQLLVRITGATSGWRLLDNGTYIRIYDSRSTGRGSSNNNRGSTTSLSGSSSASSSGSSSRGSTVDPSLNTIMGAAQGPGDYHGTMKKSELEKEAGGTVFSSTNQETRNQVENTRYQGSFRYETRYFIDNNQE